MPAIFGVISVLILNPDPPAGCSRRRCSGVRLGCSWRWTACISCCRARLPRHLRHVLRARRVRLHRARPAISAAADGCAELEGGLDPTAPGRPAGRAAGGPRCPGGGSPPRDARPGLRGEVERHLLRPGVRRADLLLGGRGTQDRGVTHPWRDAPARRGRLDPADARHRAGGLPGHLDRLVPGRRRVEAALLRDEKHGTELPILGACTTCGRTTRCAELPHRSHLAAPVPVLAMAVVAARPPGRLLLEQRQNCGEPSCAAEILLLGTPVLWWVFHPRADRTAWVGISRRDWAVGGHRRCCRGRHPAVVLLRVSPTTRTMFYSLRTAVPSPIPGYWRSFMCWAADHGPGVVVSSMGRYG